MAREFYYAKRNERGDFEFSPNPLGKSSQAHRSPSDPHKGYTAVDMVGESVIMVGPVGQRVAAYGPAAEAKLLA